VHDAGAGPHDDLAIDDLAIDDRRSRIAPVCGPAVLSVSLSPIASVWASSAASVPGIRAIRRSASG
jgi:hypothetical protein